jgi:pentatricopeptide repeat protein
MENPSKKRCQLIDLFAKNGDLDSAFVAFHSLKTQHPTKFELSSLMTGCLRCNQPEKVITLWAKYKDVVAPDYILYTLLSRANDKVGNASVSLELFAAIKSQQFKPTEYDFAQLIGAFNKQSMYSKSLEVLDFMYKNRFLPNSHACALLIDACSHTSAYKTGKNLHNWVLNTQPDIYINNSLIDMYAKCGRIADARSVFEGIKNKDVATWTALIGGLATHGDYDKMMEMFHQMKMSGVLPNATTFVTLLNGCSHANKLEEALTLLETMKTEFHIEPTIQHHTCIVDNYGRSGRLDEAERYLNSLRHRGIEANLITYKTLLGA